MLKIGDKVRFNDCPFNKQVPEELLMFNFLATQIMIVKDVNETQIKTDMTPEWLEQGWFKKAEE